MKRMPLYKRIQHELKYQFLWIGRFLITWNDYEISIGFYDKDLEVSLWEKEFKRAKT